jgi:hypothetical protein
VSTGGVRSPCPRRGCGPSRLPWTAAADSQDHTGRPLAVTPLRIAGLILRVVMEVELAGRLTCALALPLRTGQDLAVLRSRAEGDGAGESEVTGEEDVSISKMLQRRVGDRFGSSSTTSTGSPGWSSASAVMSAPRPIQSTSNAGMSSSTARSRSGGAAVAGTLSGTATRVRERPGTRKPKPSAERWGRSDDEPLVRPGAKGSVLLRFRYSPSRDNVMWLPCSVRRRGLHRTEGHRTSSRAPEHCPGHS